MLVRDMQRICLKLVEAACQKLVLVYIFCCVLWERGEREKSGIYLDFQSAKSV